MKRQKMSTKQSRANFSRGTRVKSKNTIGAPMRGGIRL